MSNRFKISPFYFLSTLKIKLPSVKSNFIPKWSSNHQTSATGQSFNSPRKLWQTNHGYTVWKTQHVMPIICRVTAPWRDQCIWCVLFKKQWKQDQEPLTANAILLCFSFSSSAAFSSSFLTLAMLSLFRTCQLQPTQVEAVWQKGQHYLWLTTFLIVFNKRSGKRMNHQ